MLRHFVRFETSRKIKYRRGHINNILFDTDAVDAKIENMPRTAMTGSPRISIAVSRMLFIEITFEVLRMLVDQSSLALLDKRENRGGEATKLKDSVSCYASRIGFNWST